MPDIWASSIQTQDYNVITENFLILKKQLTKSLWEADWMDNNKKKLFADKCENLNLVMFTGPNQSQLKLKYNNLNISADYQRNLLELQMHYRRSVYNNAGSIISAQTM